MYLKKVNPYRVHVGTELTVDDKGQAAVSVRKVVLCGVMYA